MTNQLYIELAARCPVEILEAERVVDGVLSTRYRFDTRHIGGDYTVISIPVPFAEPTHMAARAALFAELKRWFQ